MEINLIKSVLQNYPIQSIHIDRDLFLQKNKQGHVFNSVSKVFKITALSGTYILKKYPHYLTNIMVLEKIIDYQLYLRDKGLPIPLYVKSFDENRVVKIIENGQMHFFSLQHFSAGYTGKLNKNHLRQAAFLLSAYHKVSVSYYSDKNFFSIFPNKDILKDTLLLAKNAYKELLTQRATKFNFHEKKNIQFFFNTCYIQLFKITDIINSTDLKENNLVVHGDYHPKNIIYGINKAVALIDFDNCGIDNPLNDIIRFILHSCYYNFETPIEETRKIDSEKAKYFLNIYFSEINQFMNVRYLPETIYAISRIISTEMIIIAVLRGYIFSFNNIMLYINSIDCLSKEIKNIFEDVYGK